MAAHHKTKSGITADSGRGRVLLALRAGRMTASEMNERFSTINPDLAGLCRLGLIVRISDGGGIFYEITDAGRAACPLRNPLAAKAALAPAGALGGRVASTSPRAAACMPNRMPAAAPDQPSIPKEIHMSKTVAQPSPRVALLAAIAGVTKAEAIPREDLVARAGIDVPRSTLNLIFSELVGENSILGAHGATTARRYFDLRTEPAGSAAAKAPRILPRAAVEQAIADITKAAALDKTALINAVTPLTDASRAQIAELIKRMSNEATVLGAYGATAARRYFDIRTLQRTEAVSPADPCAKGRLEKAETRPANSDAPRAVRPTPRPLATSPRDTAAPLAETTAGTVEFSVYSDGRLAIIDGDEILVLQPDDTRRLAYFLGCFDTKPAIPHLLAA